MFYLPFQDESPNQKSADYADSEEEGSEEEAGEDYVDGYIVDRILAHRFASKFAVKKEDEKMADVANDEKNPLKPAPVSVVKVFLEYYCSSSLFFKIV